MSYKLDGKDIVVSGFDTGIADSPYVGISDARNVEISSIPGEASVAMQTTNPQPLVSSAVFTADAATDTLTWSGSATTGIVGNQLAITVANSGGALPSGLSAGTTYYIRNSTSTTFQLSATPGGSIIDITTNGTGTNSFSTINISTPKHATTYLAPVANFSYFQCDDVGRVWWWNGTFWVFLNNTLGSVFKGNGIVAWHDYLFYFHDAVIDYLQISSLLTGSWNNWGFAGTTGLGVNPAIVGETDDVVYFCNGPEIGTWQQNVGKTFDPTDASTFVFTQDALSLPSSETAQCLGQLQTNILVGGQTNVVYSWDRISVGYIPIFLAENGVYQIVGVNTNAFIFAGDRGRIYITNGAQADVYKKMPDHLSGIPNPLFTWGGASYVRNQLYFGISATTPTGTNIDQYGGLWAIDLKTEALRLQNELSYGNYSGRATTVQPIRGSAINLGYGLFIGWTDTFDSTNGIDKTTTAPYSAGQAYIDSDLIPIGTYINPLTPTQLEWKVSVPLVANESVALYYRLNFGDTYTLIPTVTTSLVGAISDLIQTNFEKAQWVQLRAVLTSTASSPSYTRLTEIRLRDYPQ